MAKMPESAFLRTCLRRTSESRHYRALRVEHPVSPFTRCLAMFGTETPQVRRCIHCFCFSGLCEAELEDLWSDQRPPPGPLSYEEALKPEAENVEDMKCHELSVKERIYIMT